jgi:membrane-bound metal-dependent hydrolase YbcI (DUF457 family)
MTGKTHMAISAATVAVAMSATGARAWGSFICLPCFLPSDPVTRGSGPYAIAGLLVLGMVAGLFPDLDAPDTELQHLPRKAAHRLGWYMTGRFGGMRLYSLPSPLARLTQGSISLLAVPITLLVSAIGAGLRASPLGAGHRGFTHTLWGALVFTSMAAGAALVVMGSVHWALTVGAVWLLGYASHLAADACTPSGIPLFMSLKHLARASTTATFHLLPKRMWVRTGTLVDTLVLRWIAWTACTLAVISMFMS